MALDMLKNIGPGSWPCMGRTFAERGDSGDGRRGKYGELKMERGGVAAIMISDALDIGKCRDPKT
jgi:hypothetical protein